MANGTNHQWYLKLKMIESITISIKCPLDDFYFLEIHWTTVTTVTTVPVGSKNRKKYFICGEQWTGNVHWILISIFECYWFSCHELSLVNLYVKFRMVCILYFIIGHHCANCIIINHCRVDVFGNRYI